MMSFRRRWPAEQPLKRHTVLRKFCLPIWYASHQTHMRMRTRMALTKAGQRESNVLCVCDTHQVGRGSWSQDKSLQHPWMADVERKGGIVPGPGNYKTPPRKQAGGRISDARPTTRDDYTIKRASQQPGPLEYAQLALVLPQA